MLAAGSFALKGAGPLALGGRTLPPRLARVAALLPAALLAALVAQQTFVSGAGVVAVDARAAGLAAAAVAVWRRAPFLVVVVVAAAVTAGLRALGGR